MTSSLIIHNADADPLMQEEILALVRAKVAVDENIGEAIDAYIAVTDSLTLVSMEGVLGMAEIAGVLTPELRERSIASRITVTRQ